jgi:tetratricopeptide (TPR) repeat protein
MNDIAADLNRSLDADNPWPGLMPFTEATQAFFHGRDSEAAELLRRARRQRLTILFGQSGLGKTSLLCAGLFPRLRAVDFLPVYIRLDWTTAQMSPAAQIKQALAENLAEHGVEGPRPPPDETLWGYFHDKETEFWSRRNRLITPVLVIDQFEEIFTLGQGASTSEAVLEELAALIENHPPDSLRRALDDDPEAAPRYDFAKDSCRVILALREDFLPDLEGLRRRMPSIMENRMRLTRMDGRQARDAILASGGHLVAPGVAEKVIAFVAASRGRTEGETVGEQELAGLEIEPALLSIVCSELNNKRIRLGQAQITADLLEGAQQEIVGQFYESSLAGIDPALKLFIEEQLLTAEGYRDTRPLAEALREPGVTRADIDTLVLRRLLRIEERFGTQWVELTHDLLTGVIRQRRDLRREQTEAEARVQAERERAERAEAEAARERAERKAQTTLAREAAERERVQRRLAHRFRIAFAATTLTLVLAIVAGIYAWSQRQVANSRAAEASEQRRLAEEQAGEATLSYALALKAAQDNVKIVDSHYKTGEIGTEVAKSLLDAARATFGGLPSARESADTTRSRIKLFSKLAETYRTFGDLAAALDAARTEKGLAERLAEAGPEGGRDLADSHSQIGEGLLSQGDLTGARKEYETTLAILEPAAAQDPVSSDLQHDLATGHDHFGNVLHYQGDLAGSLSNYKAALAMMEQLAAKDPSKALWRNELSTAHADIGAALKDQGDLSGAIKEFQAGLAIRMQLVTTEPINPQWQQDLVLSHRQVSEALSARGDLAGASSEAQAALTLASQLAEKDPANASWQLRLVDSHGTLGSVKEARGDVTGALQEYRAGLAISEALAARDPANTEWQERLENSHAMTGGGLQAQGNLEGAKKEFEAALAILEPAAVKYRVNSYLQHDLATGHEHLGGVLQQQGDLAGSLSHYKADLTIMERLTAKDPSEVRWREDLAAAHADIGNVLNLQGDLAAAMGEFQAGLAIRKQLATADPTNAQWQQALAASRREMSVALQQHGDLVGARSEAESALSSADQLAAKDPANASSQAQLRASHTRLGDLLLAQGDFVEAINEYQTAFKIASTLAAGDSRNASWQFAVANAQTDIGNALESKGDFTGALGEFQTARSMMEALTATDPADAETQESLALVHMKIAD